MQQHCEPGPLCAGRPPAADTLYSRHKPLLLFKGFRAFRVPALAGKPLTYGLGFLPPEPAKAHIQRTTKPAIIASLLCLVNPLY
jgi:hypothetical protein